jgi:hypothetical protein
MSPPAALASNVRQEVLERVYRVSARQSLPWIAATHVFVVFLHVRETEYLRGGLQLLLALMHCASVVAQTRADCAADCEHAIAPIARTVAALAPEA